MIVVAAVIAAVLLLPSLALLYSLVLRGRFDPGREPAAPGAASPIQIGRWELVVGLAAGIYAVGAIVNIFSSNAWQRAIGVAALLGGLVWGFVLLGVPPKRIRWVMP